MTWSLLALPRAFHARHLGSSWSALVVFSLALPLLALPSAHARDGGKPRVGKPSDAPVVADEAVVGPAATQASRERAAKRACLTGDAERGVALLTDLYIDTNDTTYLFNQGRCFEQNRRYEDAIGRFREYLIKAKNLRAEDRAETEQHIATCESWVRGKPTEATKPEEPPAKAVVGLAEPTPAPAIVVTPEPRPSRAGARLRAAGLVTGALGAAGLVTGVVLNLKANSMSGDLETEYDPAVASSRKQYKTGAWIAYGVGAACLATGVALYSLGWWRANQTNSLALVPTLAPDMAGTVLLGAF